MDKKAWRIICVILAVLLAISVTCCFFVFKALNKERAARADDNLYNWSRILEISQKIQQVDDTQHARDIFHLQNGIVFTIFGNELSPDFDNLEGPTTEEYFLTVHFNDFVHMLSLSKGTETDLDERFALLHEMGKELEVICKRVLEYGEKGQSQKLELMDEKSEIYKEIKAEINAFCSKYTEKINKYN